MSLTSQQIEIMRYMIADNPDPIYMAQLAAMNDSDAGNAVSSYATTKIVDLNNKIADLQNSLTLVQANIASLTSTITIFTI